MTGPAPIGYPDWQRTFSGVHNVLLLQSLFSFSSQQSFGPFTTANMHSIGVSLNANNNHADVGLAWFQDQACTILRTQDFIDVRNGDTFDQSVRVKGPFLKVFLNPGSVVPVNLTVVIFEVTDDYIAQNGANDNLLIGTSGTSVGAGATVRLDVGHVKAASAAFMAYSDNAASWFAELLSQDAFGNFNLMCHLNNATPVETHLVFLPACHVLVNLRNNDAAAKNFICTLSCRPLYL